MSYKIYGKALTDRNDVFDFTIELDSPEISKEYFTRMRFVEITIPSDIRKIGDLAFKSCQFLRTLKFEKNTDIEIGNYAFAFCNLSEVVLPSGARISPASFDDEVIISYSIK